MRQKVRLFLLSASSNGIRNPEMRMRSRLYLAVIILASVLLPICLPVHSAHSVPMQTSSESVTALQYGRPRELSQLKDDRINESSGIAASIRYKNAFWTHNDSGDSARIFLISEEGRTLAVAGIKGVSAVDWEDIASFKLGNEDYILIADVGNNKTRRESFVLYIIREPVINVHFEGEEAPEIEVEPDLKISFRYEDEPHDCEAVAVDPVESMIYLVSKDSEECMVYSLPIPSNESIEPNIAKPVASLKVHYANALDISPDGRRAVVLTYEDGYEFSRENGETWVQAFSREPRIIQAPVRSQGEAVCYGPDGKTLYLTSEKAHQPLWEIPVVESPK
jgi:hypothetical protein